MPVTIPTISRRWLFALSASALLVMGARLGAQGAPTQPATGTPGSAAVAAAAPAAPAAPKPRESWTSDRRNFVVGDIVTVLIDDYTISTAVKENIASDQRTRELGMNAKLPTSSKSVGIDTRNSATQQQRGTARRENRFQNEMSVRVVSVGPNGLLQLKGTKKIDVDKAKQDIEFGGWVRAQDISPQNYVESNRVADVTIGYASPGNLAKPKQGILTKILGALWP
jgi:flagellar L-ring protein precursor FlgH